MKLIARKLEVLDLGQLQSLVMEHLDGIEAGLTVIDSRLLLGRATVDIVALDAEGSLVLVTAGFTADEEMLLKAVEAYSWCLEYPDALRRLYPSVEVSSARPPRLMFVVERLPDAFHRKIKQLGFCEVDCVEFRHLDVSGTPAAYFDTIARLRRGSGVAEFQPAPIARRVSEAPSLRTPAMTPVERSVDHGDKVVPLSSAPSARATSVRLQKMLNTTGPSHGNGAAPVIDLAARSAAATSRPEPQRVEAPRFEASRAELAAPKPEITLPQVDVVEAAVETVPIAEPEVELAGVEVSTVVETMPTIDREQATAELAQTDDLIADAVPADSEQQPVLESVAHMALRDAIAAPAPLAAASAPAETSEPRVSFAEIATELLGKAVGAPRDSIVAIADAGENATPVAAKPTFAAPKPAIASTPSVPAAKPVAPTSKPIAPAPKLIAPAPKPVVPTQTPIAPAPKPIAPAPKPIAPAPKPIVPAPKPTAPAPKSTGPAPKPIAPAPKTSAEASGPAAATPDAAAPSAATSAAAETPAPSLPQEFDGLKFPNDGVLTRQWMEFLNQMASNK